MVSLSLRHPEKRKSRDESRCADEKRRENVHVKKNPRHDVNAETEPPVENHSPVNAISLLARRERILRCLTLATLLSVLLALLVSSLRRLHRGHQRQPQRRLGSMRRVRLYRRQ